jgi:hypothetical protein
MLKKIMNLALTAKKIAIIRNPVSGTGYRNELA